MIKTIYLNDNQSVEVNSSAGWLLIYKEAFGRDILPELMPVIEAALEAMVEFMSSADEQGEMSIADAAGILQSGGFINALSKLSMLEFTTLIQMFWALAKNADRSIPNPLDWVNQFESFPIDEITRELFDIVTASMISSKNSNRLKGLLDKTKNLGESTSTSSSSEQPAEA